MTLFRALKIFSRQKNWFLQKKEGSVSKFSHPNAGLFWALYLQYNNYKTVLVSGFVSGKIKLGLNESLPVVEELVLGAG